MPDRRQADRRASSPTAKKLSISLNSFIFIVVIFLLVIAFIFSCSYISSVSYNKGYERGYNDCYFLSSEHSYDSYDYYDSYEYSEYSEYSE